MSNERGTCWWTLQVKISHANCWLATCLLDWIPSWLRVARAWKKAADSWHESLKPLEPIEDTDTFQMDGTATPHKDKVK